jgi:hypothetical protein
VQRSSVVVIVIVLLGGVARAQDSTGGGEQCWCSPGTAHEGMEVACDDTCTCTDSCGGDSGGGGGYVAPRAPRQPMTKAQKAEVGVFLWLFTFWLGPGHMAEILINGGEHLPPTHAVARQRWNDFRARIVASERIGRLAASKRSRLAAAEDIGETTPDAPRSFAWNPPHLVPSIPFQCDKALIELPLGYPNPGGFADMDAMCNACPCSKPAASRAPDPPDQTCPADTLTCTGDNVCCPRDAPIYNPCDQNCYAGSNFGLSPKTDGAACDHYTDCRGAKP